MSCIAARSLRVDRVALAALVFAGIGGFSTIVTYGRDGLSMREVIVSLAYLARWLFYFGMYLFMINCIRGRDVRGIWNAMERMIIAFSAFGIVQAIFLPNFAFILNPDARPFIDFDPQGHRLVSTILEPNVAGLIIAIGLLVHLSLLAMGQRVAWWKMLLLFAALLATVSRSAVIGLLAGAVVIVAVRGLTRRIVRVSLAVLTIILILLPQLLAVAKQYNKFDLSTNSSAGARYEAWLRAIDLFVAHPIIGIGFNTFAAMINRTTQSEAIGVGRASSEGGLLFAATLTGVVGLAVYSWMLALVVLRCRYIWRHPRAAGETRALAMGSASMLVALCVHSIFVNTMFATFTMEIFWIFAGLTFVMARELADGDRSAAVPSVMGLRGHA
jgi:O-antigen ligase